MKIASVLAAGALGVAALFAFAQTKTDAAPKAAKAPVAAATGEQAALEESIKKAIAPRLGDNVQVDAVTKSPYADLYEVRMGGDVLYTDKTGQYLFLGKIIDLNTREDMVQKRMAEINRIDFKDLPFDSAIKMVKGNGKNVIAVFEDPNCGYCKRLRKTLAGMNDVTVYTFMYNILAEDSSVKSRNIWCSKDRLKAWDDWMLSGVNPAEASPQCNAPNDAVYALGQKLHINGTPAIFFTDGLRVSGAMEQAALEKKFSEIK